jgi:hypothetical protein
MSSDFDGSQNASAALVQTARHKSFAFNRRDTMRGIVLALGSSLAFACGSGPESYYHLAQSAQKHHERYPDSSYAAAALFCAKRAQEFNTRADRNQAVAIGITGTGVVLTAAGSGASLLAAQMDQSGRKTDALQAGAILTAAGLAAVGVAAIFDWGKLSKRQAMAAAEMAESAVRIRSDPKESGQWYAACTDSAEKVAEGIPEVKAPPAPAPTGTGTAGQNDPGANPLPPPADPVAPADAPPQR